MSVGYKILPEINLIVAHAHGVCSTASLLRLNKDSIADPDRKPNMKILMDLRFCSLDVDLADIKAMIEFNKELKQKGWEMESTAFITNSSLVEILCQAYELMSAGLGIHLKVFSEVKDALEWLGLSENLNTISSLEIRQLSSIPE